jgi:hypothetical protein
LQSLTYFEAEAEPLTVSICCVWDVCNWVIEGLEHDVHLFSTGTVLDRHSAARAVAVQQLLFEFDNFPTAQSDDSHAVSMN